MTQIPCTHTGAPTPDPRSAPDRDLGPRLLVVDDDPQLRRALRINLRAHRYEVDTAADGTRALAAAAAVPPDLVVLDLGLPDMDGVEVIRGLRGWSAAPIIVLSGRAGSADKVGALDAGADDYLTKPFGVEELLARLRALTRRRGPDTTPDHDAADPPTVHLGEHTIDLAAHQITTHTRRGDLEPHPNLDRHPDLDLEPHPDLEPIAPARTDPTDRPARQEPPAGMAPVTVRLTRTEWRLLEALVRHPGALRSQQQLLREVWGPGYNDETHYLRVYMNRLRRKLETDPARPRHLLTEPGRGCRFQP